MLFRDDLSLKGRRGQEKGEREGEREEGEKRERKKSEAIWLYSI